MYLKIFNFSEGHSSIYFQIYVLTSDNLAVMTSKNMAKL